MTFGGLGRAIRIANHRDDSQMLQGQHKTPAAPNKHGGEKSRLIFTAI